MDTLDKHANCPLILVIDDDKRLRDLLYRYLSSQNLYVITADNTKEAESLLKKFFFDIVIVDVMMPVENGLDFTKRIKPEYPHLPFLMLTAKTETEDRISGLEAGVDDYLPKPFEPKELWLRIQAILRRTQEPGRTKNKKMIGIYEFIEDTRLLKNKEEEVLLTESETTLLSRLYAQAGEIINRYELAQDLGLESGERTIDVQITRLRKKIEKDPKKPQYLQTVRGKGYILRV